ncbi:hypothetical protein PLESTM_000223600 [Pleodorina starrii]|nr:hypothetical protein PLESTM_000223600 [Pleodorina starrii]
MSKFGLVKTTELRFVKGNGTYVGTTTVCGNLHNKIAAAGLRPGAPAGRFTYNMLSLQFHNVLTSMTFDEMKRIARGQEPHPETWRCILESPPSSPRDSTADDDEWGDFTSASSEDPLATHIGSSWAPSCSTAAIAQTNSPRTSSSASSGFSPRTPPATTTSRFADSPAPASSSSSASASSSFVSSSSIASRQQRLEEALQRAAPTEATARRDSTEGPAVTIAISPGAEQALRHAQAQLAAARREQRQKQQRKQQHQAQLQAAQQAQLQAQKLAQHQAQQQAQLQAAQQQAQKQQQQAQLQAAQQAQLQAQKLAAQQQAQQQAQLQAAQQAQLQAQKLAAQQQAQQQAQLQAAQQAQQKAQKLAAQQQAQQQAQLQAAQQQAQQKARKQSEAAAEPQQPATPPRQEPHPPHLQRLQRLPLASQPTQEFDFQLPTSHPQTQAAQLTPRLRATSQPSPSPSPAPQPQPCPAAVAAAPVEVAASKPLSPPPFSRSFSLGFPVARPVAVVSSRPSLKRLPSQAREENGDKVQEGTRPDELLREDCRVTLQVGLSSQQRARGCWW